MQPCASWPRAVRARTLARLEALFKVGMSGPGLRYSGSPIIPLLGMCCLVLTLACSRPLDRPLEGAPPVRGAQPPAPFVEPPPTLTAPAYSSDLPPPPPAIPMPSPSPSPALAGRNPILSGLLPAPDALVPPGPVSIGARIVASAELADVVLLLNGSTVQPEVTPRDLTTWVVAYTGRLDIGKHEVRLNAKDREGRAGGYRWQFEVKPRSQASTPTPPATQPAPTQTPASRTRGTQTPPPRP
jgi:hypothetical protein